MTEEKYGQMGAKMGSLFLERPSKKVPDDCEDGHDPWGIRPI